MLQIPQALQQLVAEGKWPRDSREALRQNLQPLVPVERIRQIAPEESWLYLYAPPFHTVSERASTDKYWLDVRSAPTEINFELSLDIGDFGLGSDAALILDYRQDQLRPRVLRLRWSETGAGNHWVEVAPNFDEFARALGLLPTG